MTPLASFDDLVAVHRVGHARVPREVAPCVMVAEQHFETRVADLSGLYEHRRVARRRRGGRFEGLVEGVRTVPRGVEVELAAEEAGVEAHLPRLGLLGLEVVVREAVERIPFVRLALVVVVGFGQVGRIGGSHGRIGGAQAEEREPFGQARPFRRSRPRDPPRGRRRTCISRRPAPTPSRCGPSP